MELNKFYYYVDVMAYDALICQLLKSPPEDETGLDIVSAIIEVAKVKLNKLIELSPPDTREKLKEVISWPSVLSLMQSLASDTELEPTSQYTNQTEETNPTG